MSITNKKLGSKWAQSWHANSTNFDDLVGSMESLYFATLAGEWDTLWVHVIDRLQLSEQHGMSTNPWKPWGQRPDNSVSWPSFPYFQKSRWSSILHPHNHGTMATINWWNDLDNFCDPKKNRAALSRGIPTTKMLSLWLLLRKPKGSPSDGTTMQDMLALEIPLCSTSG